MTLYKHILMNRTYQTLLLLFFSSSLLWAQQTPASSQNKSILILGATAHIGDGTVIENSAIGFENGKLTLVSTEATISQNFDRTISAEGMHVYPGFIAANATLGLVEISAVRATNDADDIGAFLPHVRSIIAYNAESKIVESVRPNGVLIAQITPRGGTISGKSSIVQLDAWNWEDAALRVDDGIHLNWPNPYKRGRWWLGEDPTIKENDAYQKDVRTIHDFMGKAQAYLQSKPKKKDLPAEAMRGVFEGSQAVYLHANDEKQIVDAVSYLKNLGIEKVVLIGGNDAHLQARFLKEHDVAVVISRPHRLPAMEDQDIKLPFKMAHLLMEAGLTVSIDTSGRMERMNTRNLPFYAGSFAAYGVPKEKAVQMITGNAAKILGVEDRMGTLAVGKDATLFISEGDALDMRSNQLTHAFIQGREISLETHQTKLWKRYSEKYASEE